MPLTLPDMDAMSRNDYAPDGAQDTGSGVGNQGPPTELPDTAPEFVGDVLATIDDFLAGSVESLGEAVSGIASNAMAGDAAVTLSNALSVIPL